MTALQKLKWGKPSGHREHSLLPKMISQPEAGMKEASAMKMTKYMEERGYWEQFWVETDRQTDRQLYFIDDQLGNYRLKRKGCFWGEWRVRVSYTDAPQNT